MPRPALPTLRGVVVLAAGVVVMVAGSLLGESDLVPLGLALCFLPVLAILGVTFLRPRVHHERALEPPQVTVGDPTEVTLRLRNRNPLAAAAITCTDEVPDALGSNARFTVLRAFGRWNQSVRYRLDTGRRGRHVLGPLRVRATDPLGLASITSTSPGAPSLLRVTPHVWPIADAARGAGLGATGESSPQRTGAASQDDVLVREHRHGDDIRRVHWRMSAKTGELMVRLEEHPWDPSALLLVDTRRSRHSGTDRHSSLEWAISAAASIALELVADRHRLWLSGPSGSLSDPSAHPRGGQTQGVLDALTDVEATDEASLDAALSNSSSLDASGVLLHVGGLLDADDAASLCAAAIRHSKPQALVVDPRSWGLPSDQHDDAVAMLRAAGWAVEQYGRGESVTDAFARLTLRRTAA